MPKRIKEITVSCYLMTENHEVAQRAAETLTRVMTGFAFEGGVSTDVRVGTVYAPDDDQDDNSPII